jgi:hypothetical protein
MKTITLLSSTHRPETLAMTECLLAEQQTIILEEPPHPDFLPMLQRQVDIEDYLLELDHEYPLFIREQYTFLQKQVETGVSVLQIEPYLEGLLQLQLFLAEDNTPADLDPDAPNYAIYQAERQATGLLIDYYQTVRKDSFIDILKALRAFAVVDAARFKLRDKLRARAIAEALGHAGPVGVEVGSMHLLLGPFLETYCSSEWKVKVENIDALILKKLGLSGSVFGPGDELTACYLLNKPLTVVEEMTLCARSLIHNKLILKEERLGAAEEYPHARDEYHVNTFVSRLNLRRCRELFVLLRPLSTEKARKMVRELR